MLDRLRRVQLGQHRRQVGIDLEGQARLVGPGVGAIAPDRVLLQLVEVRRQRIAGDPDLAAQLAPPLVRVGADGLQLHDQLQQALRRPQLPELIRQRQVAVVEGAQAEDRSPHQRKHHPDDEAQPRDQLDADGPLRHGDDLLVAGGPTPSWKSVRCSGRAGGLYQSRRAA
jgi:hypothetical protein